MNATNATTTYNNNNHNASAGGAELGSSEDGVSAEAGPVQEEEDAPAETHSDGVAAAESTTQANATAAGDAGDATAVKDSGNGADSEGDGLGTDSGDGGGGAKGNGGGGAIATLGSPDRSPSLGGGTAARGRGRGRGGGRGASNNNPLRVASAGGGKRPVGMLAFPTRPNGLPKSAKPWPVGVEPTPPPPLDFMQIAKALDKQPYSAVVRRARVPTANRIGQLTTRAKRDEAIEFARSARPVAHVATYRLLDTVFCQYRDGLGFGGGGGGGGGGGDGIGGGGEGTSSNNGDDRGDGDDAPALPAAAAGGGEAFYAALTAEEFLDRFIRKRPLTFYSASDSHLLRDGTRSAGEFDTIGTDREDRSAGSLYKIEDYMSYDEIALASQLAVSSRTFFVNTGERGNQGRPGTPGTFEEQGVYVGQVGARFEVPGKMDWRFMMVTEEQNTAANGYGADRQEKAHLQAWAEYFGVKYFPSFAEVEEHVKHHPVKVSYKDTHAPLQTQYIEVFSTTGRMYLNCEVYRRRMQLAAETFLIEANDRARELKKRAHCFIVGLGLGVWSRHLAQAQMYKDAFAVALSTLQLPHIACLEFSWFKEEGFSAPLERSLPKSVRITWTKNPPAAPRKLPKNQLLVAQYAWDGNAYPGNEYWLGLLSASGDPAAACCSNIGELQNPDVNPHYVCARNLHVAAAPAVDGGLLPQMPTGLAATHKLPNGIFAKPDPKTKGTCVIS